MRPFPRQSTRSYQCRTTSTRRLRPNTKGTPPAASSSSSMMSAFWRSVRRSSGGRFPRTSDGPGASPLGSSRAAVRWPGSPRRGARWCCSPTAVLAWPTSSGRTPARPATGPGPGTSRSPRTTATPGATATESICRVATTRTWVSSTSSCSARLFSYRTAASSHRPTGSTAGGTLVCRLPMKTR